MRTALNAKFTFEIRNPKTWWCSFMLGATRFHNFSTLFQLKFTKFVFSRAEIGTGMVVRDQSSHLGQWKLEEWRILKKKIWLERESETICFLRWNHTFKNTRRACKKKTKKNYPYSEISGNLVRVIGWLCLVISFSSSSSMLSSYFR